jgi:signal transduction histidine kinase
MKNRWLYLSLTFLASLILLLGGWWVSLLLRLGKTLSTLNVGSESDYAKLVKMLSWEGIFFVFLVILFCAGLFWLFWQDRKKQKSMQQFFASITHELKTPLASVSMQSEFISELIDENSEFDLTQRQQISKLTKRLIDDTKNLETQFDKAMQLSRIERGGVLTQTPIDLNSLVAKEISKHRDLKFKLEIPQECFVLADEYALQTIFRNLIDNTKKHRTNNNQKITINCKIEANKVHLTYNDHGAEFGGEIKMLGQLFYKYNSGQGTGIGMYIINKLTQAMQGQLLITAAPNLVFEIILRNCEQGQPR